MIKILFFSPIPILQDAADIVCGGWIESFLLNISKHESFEVSVAFFHSTQFSKTKVGNITCYCMHRPQSFFHKAGRFFRLSAQDCQDLSFCKSVVADFKPDIIHVFGTESSFGLIARETTIPVVIHLQGLMGPYLNAWVPPGYQMLDYVRQGSLNPLRIALGFRALSFNRHAAERERQIMRFSKVFMGRTAWDRAFVSLYAPQAKYFTCWETLRSCFYEPGKWVPPTRPVFVSTISNPLYKGHDMILKTALVLRDSGISDFSWHVYGVPNLRFAEFRTGIRASNVGIRPMGVVTAEQLREGLLHSSVYVHPSYIDNSPNSICEAQILGIPVVATNVGGVSSLVASSQSRCLVPANDPVMMAERIREALATPEAFISDVRHINARHNQMSIAETAVVAYLEILNRNSYRCS